MQSFEKCAVLGERMLKVILLFGVKKEKKTSFSIPGNRIDKQDMGTEVKTWYSSN